MTIKGLAESQKNGSYSSHRTPTHAGERARYIDTDRDADGDIEFADAWDIEIANADTQDTSSESSSKSSSNSSILSRTASPDHDDAAASNDHPDSDSLSSHCTPTHVGERARYGDADGYIEFTDAWDTEAPDADTQNTPSESSSSSSSSILSGTASPNSDDTAANDDPHSDDLSRRRSSVQFLNVHMGGADPMGYTSLHILDQIHDTEMGGMDYDLVDTSKINNFMEQKEKQKSIFDHDRPHSKTSDRSSSSDGSSTFGNQFSANLAKAQKLESYAHCVENHEYLSFRRDSDRQHDPEALQVGTVFSTAHHTPANQKSLVVRRPHSVVFIQSTGRW